MKRFFAFIIAFLILFPFSACRNETEVSKLTEEMSEPENSLKEEKQEEIPAFHKEILINFGGTELHDGTLVVSKKFSFYYDLSAGYPDLSLLTPNSFYSWTASRTDNSDKIKVDISGEGSGIYVYPADFYESEITEYFEVSPEHLRKSSFYYPEQNCYFRAGLPEGSYDITIEYNSSKEEDGILRIYFSLSDRYYGTTKHTLSVKLLPEGGYKYISYVPYFK